MSKSPFLLAQELERQLVQKLSGVDVFGLPTGERKIVETMRREIVDFRLDVRDYELSETRAEQLNNAEQAKTRATLVRKNILQVSEYGVFGSADVAQLTAQLDQITERLE